MKVPKSTYLQTQCTLFSLIKRQYLGSFFSCKAAPHSEILLEKTAVAQRFRIFSRLLQKTKVNYSIHNSSTLIPIQSLINPTHTRINCYFKKNLLLTSQPLLASKVISFFQIFQLKFVCISHTSCQCKAPLPFHPQNVQPK